MSGEENQIVSMNIRHQPLLVIIVHCDVPVSLMYTVCMCVCNGTAVGWLLIYDFHAAVY